MVEVPENAEPQTKEEAEERRKGLNHPGKVPGESDVSSDSTGTGVDDGIGATGAGGSGGADTGAGTAGVGDGGDGGDGAATGAGGSGGAETGGGEEGV